MERARPHTHVVRLQDKTALRAPEIVQREDHVLKACLRVPLHDAAQWLMPSKPSMPGAHGA
ncbi:hypothetical protein CP97_14765 [Aurantiacibacter atlanticus]|uniref:Uncharacterized protein n=1 Tax=Aurantiacibacter atlanticus TaxID=1648404 RepID=A0A161I480_9SPHN|nr:hypothetical protein CP97_14765 [Aurantiacibacter atlanticus]